MFALVDCNNFYASCERLFRPDLIGVPILVLSNNDGCIIARSAEAKALGIKMGAPFHQCRADLELAGVRWFSSNYALYGDLSSRVMTVLEGKSPRLEVYSIDEAFLDFTGFERHFDLMAYGQDVRESVYRWTGIRVGVGIAPTKTLAKLANHLAKRSESGVAVLDSPERIQEALDKLEVSDVWGIGRKLSEKLRVEGIYTALQLSQADTAWLKKRFSVVLEKTARELRGLSCLSLEEDIPARQQIISSRSFGQRVTDLRELQAAISHHVARAGEKLRQDGLNAGGLQVFIRTGRFNPNEAQYSGSVNHRFVEPTSDSLEIARTANRLLMHIWKPDYRYAKAGVMLVDLDHHKIHQGDLFNDSSRAGKPQLMTTLDQLNQRFPGGVFLGRSAVCKDDKSIEAWRISRNYLSPAYTTNWNELPVVR